MNKIISTDAQAAEELRRLAMVAAPAVQADPNLAETVLDRSRREQRIRRLRNAAVSVGGSVVVLAALAAPTLLGQGEFFTVTHPSRNMESTVGIGERVIFSRELSPDRGDVVIVRLANGDQAYDSIMRVVALPGDTVGCPADSAGRCDAIVVNGIPVPEPYLGSAVTEPFPTRTVPAHTVFLLGDNRPVANDSRFIGPIKLADVNGVAVSIKDCHGQTRPIPGAPAHDGPDERDNIDPAGPVPPPGVS